ncbi:MAG TPA: capsular polysaccharide biosynthesis protein, partial [Kaistiaceae bacterium]|nr:capsular polysaccharide biosynthesis protein [Kaistiaceae bacterium]
MTERPRVGIATAGLWRRRSDVATLLDADPVRLLPGCKPPVDLVAGWGDKATSRAAQALARRRGLCYVALEDGFLRSLRPGRDTAPIGYAVDRSGIYYDAGRPSDLEALIAAAARAPNPRAAALVGEIRTRRLSKYNHAPMPTAAELGLPLGADIVLVVDQTHGDAAIAGAGADAGSFSAMLAAAIAENPGRTIVVKTHPEVVSGRKRGYFSGDLARGDVRFLGDAVNPWVLLERAARLYTVSSQLGFEGLIAGVPVTCFGQPFYSGWGLTDDRAQPTGRREARPTIEALAGAALIDYCRYLDPYFRRAIEVEEAIEQLTFLRDRFHANRRTVCLGISPWKRARVASFLDGVDGPPAFAEGAGEALALARRDGAPVVGWATRMPEGFADKAAAAGVAVARMEDGFLRSVGLGAAFTQPASLVIDRLGIYYDGSRPSDFEALAGDTVFDEALIARAARLRERIVAARLSKYNDARLDAALFDTEKPVVLVPGQVEDDASIRLGSPVVRSNLALLERVRARLPDAFIVYKPHPDVEAGYRTGRIDPERLADLADSVVTDIGMPALLAGVDRVETMTSLSGFEALLRGLPVGVHGQPFYAGWGLTEDFCDFPRRARKLSLDELVALGLILYPRYVDPATGLPCPVEVVVERLLEMRERGPGGCR